MFELIRGNWSGDARTDTELSPFFKLQDELSSVDGLLLTGEAVFPPTSLRPLIIMLSHESHPGIAHTEQTAETILVAHGRMDCDVEALVKECHIYNQIFKSQSLTKHHCSLFPLLLGLGNKSGSTSLDHSGK